jgi:F-type H+-transporting ATPase subunit gamma
MTERLADIGARIDGIRQLGAVVNAMRGIAAARARQARSQLIAVESYAATIAVAIGRALALVPSARPDVARKSTRPALVLFAPSRDLQAPSASACSMRSAPISPRLNCS